MDRVHRGTGRARSAGLEEILMMYVKPAQDAVHADHRDGGLPGLDTKYFSLSHAAYISDTPNHLSQQAHLRVRLDMSQVTAWEAVDLQTFKPPRGSGRVFHVQLVSGCRLVTFLYLSQASLVITRSHGGGSFIHTTCLGYTICHVNPSSMVTSLHPTNSGTFPLECRSKCSTQVQVL